MVVVLGKAALEVVVSEEDESIETFGFDAQDKSLRDRVHVRSLVADQHGRDTGVLEDGLELVGELGIPIQDEVADPAHELGVNRCEVASDMPAAA